MGSRAFRITINNVPHLFNLNHVNKVALIGDKLRFYFNTNKDIMGLSIMGSGFFHGNSLYSVEVQCADKASAQSAFDEVARLM